MIHLNHKRLGSGTPLIVLHGLFGSLDNWMSLGRQFAEQHDVFLVDQRNHGQSGHTDEFNYDLLADDLLHFMQEHSISNPILLGHSMGGKTVMNFALRNPNLAEKIIVVDAAPKKYPVHHQTIIQGLKALDFSHINNRKQVDEVLSEYIPEMGVRQFLGKSIYWKTQEELALRFNLEALSNHIESISGWDLNASNDIIPALFIRGGRSNYILENESSIAAHFGNAKVQTIPEAGHWVHAEKPAQLLEMVLAFTS